MPLPSALAAKLAKRGIVAPAPTSKLQTEREKVQDYKGVPECPNKSNVYHDCNHWCETHWRPPVVPDPKYARKVGKMLMKYPLPQNWSEVYDKGMQHYYYWDIETDKVSWLPPKHPKAVVTVSAAKLREKLRRATAAVDEEHVPPRRPDDDKRDKRQGLKPNGRHGDRERGEKDQPSEKRRRRDDRDRERRSRNEGGGGGKEGLDPMDPAAYSDIAPGTWSDGLETNSKTGVDSTASGALFQQRPYPSPGDVLAASNKSRNKK